MKKSKQLKILIKIAVATVAIVWLIGGLSSTLYSAEPKTVTPQKPDSASLPANAAETNNATTPIAGKVVVKKQLTGAELYSIHCNRCHPERYPTERTAAQWKTIMLHMQVRANIPGNQARQILQYLQDNSGR